MTVATEWFTAEDGTRLFGMRWQPQVQPKATILISHGLGEHTGRYDHVAKALNERGYEVIGYDHRGHGRSEGDPMHVERFEDYIHDLRTVASTIEGLWVLYGHSMGGLIALGHLVDRVPPRPVAAVLSAPALEADAPAPLKVTAKILGRFAPKLRLPSSIKGHQLSRDPAVGEAYFADPLVHTKGTSRMGAELLNAMERIRSRADAIDVPTLVIHGTDDTLVPPRASAPLAAVATVERKLFPGFRHELHNEPEADEVIAHVADWIDKRLAERGTA